MATAPKKTVPLKLTNGAAHLLNLIARQPGLITDELVIYDVSVFRRDHLRNLPAAPVAGTSDADVEAWTEPTMPDIACPVEVFASLKTLLKAAIAKGIAGGGSEMLTLMTELELGRPKG